MKRRPKTSPRQPAQGTALPNCFEYLQVKPITTPEGTPSIAIGDLLEHEYKK